MIGGRLLGEMTMDVVGRRRHARVGIGAGVCEAKQPEKDDTCLRHNIHQQDERESYNKYNHPYYGLNAK